MTLVGHLGYTHTHLGPRDRTSPLHLGCEEGTGHAEERYAQDQYCYSLLTKLTGSLLMPWEVVDRGDGVASIPPMSVSSLAPSLARRAAMVTSPS